MFSVCGGVGEMKLYAWAVLAGLGVLGLPAGASDVMGQGTPPPLVELKQDHPNPLNPATTIPFTLSAGGVRNGHGPKVSLKIYSVLAPLVSVPLLQGTGQPMTDVELTCNSAGTAPCAFWAYWDGNLLNTGKEAASGVYIYQLIGDGGSEE